MPRQSTDRITPKHDHRFKDRAIWTLAAFLALSLALAWGLPSPARAQSAKTAGKAPAEAKHEEPPACLTQGQQVLNQREFTKAAELFAACAKANPKSAPAWYWLGMAHFLAHQALPAREALERCLALDPNYLAAASILGKLYSFDKAKLAQAEDLLQKVLSQRPDYEDARFDLARVYAITGRYDQSFREFNVIFKSEVRYALYHTELGKIFKSMGLEKEARQEFNRALALQPDFTPAKDQLKALDENPSVSKPDAKSEAKPPAR